MVEIVSMAEATKRLEAPRHSQINPALKAAVLRAVEALFPVKTENGDLEVRATNISIDDSKFDADALAAWQKARQEGETVAAPITASLELWRDGKKVQSLTKYEIGQLPLMGAMGTFMVKGSDWYVPMAQTRLKPGAYTREKANGEYETFIPMKGGQMTVWMDPAKGVLKIGIFSSNVSWYAIVKALGATDADIVGVLGGDKRARELLEVNRVSDTRDVTKFFMTVFEHKLNRDLLRAGLLKHDQDLVNTDYAAQVVAIKEWLASKSVDPFVTKQTLGAPITSAGLELLLKAAKNILDVQRRDVEPDDRDSPEFKTMHGVEDLIPERVAKMGRMLQRKLLTRLGKPDTTLAKGFGSNWLGPAITGNFGGENAGVTNTAEAANPLAILSEQSKLTLTGPGGIESAHAVTQGTRLFRPTSVGFVDPVHTPEGCFGPDSEVYTSKGWVRWDRVTMETEIACQVDGRLEYHTPLRTIAARYEGPMIGYKSDRVELFVTPNHRMWVRPQDRGAKYRIVEAGKLPGTNRNVMAGGHPARTGSVAPFTLPAVTAAGAGNKCGWHSPPVGAHLNKPAAPIDIVDWCRFLGWYLSEGNTSSDPKRGHYSSQITQLHTSKAECAHIEATLRRLPFVWLKHGDRRFSVSGKQLNRYLVQLGKSRTKRVPPEVFAASPEARMAFLEAALMGDGRKRTKGSGERGSNPLSRWICYCTTSKQLADDIYRLMFELGLSASISFEPDERDPKYLGCYCVHIHSFNERQLTSKNHRHKEGMYYTADYAGNIYCAEVPGGLMFCRHGKGMGFWIGNSSVGIVTHAAFNTRKVGDTLVSPFRIVKGGKRVDDKVAFLTLEEASKAVIGYPDGWDQKGEPLHDTVRANKDGKIVTLPPTEVEYMLPSGSAMFDHTSNSAAFLAHTHSNRAMMAGKHLTQALPLAQRELPLVQLKNSRGEDMGEGIAKSFVIRAKVPGKVTEVTKDHITVGSTRHEIFDQYPMQAKVALHHYPVVKAGDVVKEGDLLADSNYSRDGKLALGINLFSAYTPWKNASNYEDAIVISESAAQKLASEHMHRLDLDLEPGVQVAKKIYMAQYPTKISGDNYAKLDDDGVIKEGAEVKTGEVVIAAVRKQTFDATDTRASTLSMIHKKLERPYRDCGVVWHELPPGKVYRVVKTAKKIEVHIQTLEPMQVGDKLSMGSAAKGTVAQIVPDDKMPHTEAGRAVEVILNPHGVAGRINPSQTIEQAAGKLVKDGGVAYEHANFDGRDHAAEVAEALKKAGLSHTEKLFDPETGKWIEEPVATGYNYMVKLDHPVRKKFSARGRDGYTLDETPIAGRGRGGQSYDQLTTYALLGHNAHALLGESVGIRGMKNDEFWRAYQAGETPPPPKVPFVYNKLLTYMNAAGVDTQQHGHILHYLPMTDKRVLERSNGAITKATMVKAKNLAEEKGGLFDKEITGGLKGDNWAHIALNEAIPHPLYEKVVRDITGLKTAEFYGLLGHTRRLDPKTGKITEGGEGLTGEEAFRHLLTFRPDDKIDEFKTKLKTAVGSDRNKYNRAVQYLEGLKTSKLDAADAYLTKNVPVVPPKYRGIDELSGGALRVAPSNILYRDVMLTNDALAAGKADEMPAEHLADARLALYRGVGALVGVNNALTHRDDREDAKGFIDVIKGTENKNGLFQRMAARRRNDFTGRSTVEPDANLGVDEIGIPEDMAWKIYQPTVVRRLSQLGWKPADAMLEVEKRGPAARTALNAEMEHRLVTINRAPSLHRWNVSAHRPTLVAGKEIRVSPGIIGPMNMDYDGDTAAITVPITEAARREAFNLMPSNNLFYDKDRKLAYGMSNDIITGLFMLTRPGASSGKTYPTADAAIEAYENNKDGLRMGSLVKIEGQPTQQAIGWLIFSKIVPPRFLAGVSAPIDGPKLKALLENIAKNSPGDFNNIARNISQAGFQAAALSGGASSTINELAIDRTKIKRLLEQMERQIARGKTDDEKRKIALETFKEHAPELDRLSVEHLNAVGGAYSTFLQAKPSGKITPDQFRQMLVSPVLVTDVQDKVVPAVIKTGYGGGMTTSDYILTTPGARKGMVAKSLATALPGFLAKEIAGNMGPVRVGEKDCGTQHGIELPLHSDMRDHDADLLDRHLLHDIPGTLFKRNDPVTPKMLAELRDRKAEMIWVRSPMTCESTSPPCQMCAGRAPDGELHPVGSNIGLNYGQAVSEPSTQLTLKIFHSGGTVGSGDKLRDGFARLRELLGVPGTVRDQGVLADITGDVTGVRPAPQGGQYVSLRASDGHEVEQYVLAGRTLKVKKGDRVEAGQPLSDGNYLPQEIAAKRGLLPAQQYVVDEARKAYASAGVTVRKPVLEVLAAGMMRYMEITDDGHEKGLTIGDVIPENEFKKLQQANPRIMGRPALPGVSFKPLLSKDLMERLNFQRLEGSMMEVPAMAGKSDLTGAKSPIPGLVYGAVFRPGVTPLEHDSAFAGRSR